MKLFDLFSRKKEFKMMDGERPYYYTLAQYRDAFLDERAEPNTLMSFSFDVGDRILVIEEGSGGFTFIPFGKQIPELRMSVGGNGIRYGRFFGKIDDVAQEHGWDSVWAFDCYYRKQYRKSSSLAFVSPGYMTVTLDDHAPAHYLISSSCWRDTGQAYFEVPSFGVLGL